MTAIAQNACKIYGEFYVNTFKKLIEPINESTNLNAYGYRVHLVLHDGEIKGLQDKKVIRLPFPVANYVQQDINKFDFNTVKEYHLN